MNFLTGGSLWHWLIWMFPIFGMIGFTFTGDPSPAPTGEPKPGAEGGDPPKTIDPKPGTKDGDPTKITLDNLPDEIFQEVFNKGFKKASAQLEKKLTERLGDMGVTDEKLKEWQELEKAKVKAEEEKLHEKGEFEKLKTQLITSHEEEKKTLTSTITSQEATIRTLLVDNKITAAAVQHKAFSTEQIVSLMEKHFTLEAENGSYTAVPLDKDGNKRYNKKGDLMTVEEAVKEYLDEYPNLVIAEVQTGSGAGHITGVNYATRRIESSTDAISQGLDQRKQK